MLSVWVVGLVVGVWLSGWLECSWNWDICGPKIFAFFLLSFAFLNREYIQSKHTLSEDGSSLLIQLHSNSSSDSLDEEDHHEDHEDQDDDRSAKPPALLTEEDWG